MIIEVVLGWPVLVLARREDVPVPKSENVARQILLELDPLRYEDLVLDPDTHQAFIKRPMTEAA